MKILFLTSGLAPGKDGVGDYTRLLAGECARRGHPSALVALNDRQLDGEPEASGEQAGLPTLRMNAGRPWPERLARVHAFAMEQAPDWCSLQFVCYGFHPRGIEPGLRRWFPPIIGGKPLQIMLHELWVGAESGASWRHRLLGGVQRHGVLRLLRTLRPRVLHTSNPAYLRVLTQCGVAAAELPLFGACPLPTAPAHDWLAGEFGRVEAGLTGPGRRKFWVFGFFGTLHPVWPPEPLFSELRKAADAAGKQVVIAAIGRLGAGDALWKELVRDYSDAFRFIRLEEQPPEHVSTFLAAIDFGIATTPLALIGKSGSATAMLEHGLPVIVNRDDVQFGGASRKRPSSPQLIPLDDQFPQRLVKARRGVVRWRLPEVSERFLASLGELSP